MRPSLARLGTAALALADPDALTCSASPTPPSGAELAAVVSFHSGLESLKPEDAANINCHGADDPLVPPPSPVAPPPTCVRGTP
jgi:hypothetical protein